VRGLVEIRLEAGPLPIEAPGLTPKEIERRNAAAIQLISRRKGSDFTPDLAVLDRMLSRLNVDCPRE
jgi:hypothetical protein